MRRRNSTSLCEEPPRKRAHIRANSKSSLGQFHGQVITDVSNTRWRVGKLIGSGSFGEVYLVSDSLKDAVKLDAEYVMKIERHDSGPLFVEMNCYLRAGKLAMIQKWLKSKNINDIGMPHYITFGSHNIKSDKYRFLILPRYGQDLETIFKSKNNQFNTKTVLTVSIQILDILEYLHSKGYVHGDIKASNLMLGFEKKICPTKSMRMCSKQLFLKSKLYETYDHNTKHSYSETEVEPMERPQQANQVYLLDYGLTSRYLSKNGEHKEFCDDQRKAHAGTVLFCSRDAHAGCTSRRSDLENLAYNMLYWLTDKLPWGDDIEDPDLVNSIKCDVMSNTMMFLRNTLGDSYPSYLHAYLTYINQLSFEEKPDYDYCRKLFCKGLLEFGYKNDNFLDFDKAVSCDKLKKRFLIRKLKKQSENLRTNQIRSNVIYDRQPLGINSQVMLVRKPTLRSELNKCRKLRHTGAFNWAKVLSSNPERILRQSRLPKHEMSGRTRKSTECSDSEPSVLQIDLYSLNPTYAMIEVYNRAQDRATVPHLNQYFTKGKGDCTERHEGYTPAMEAIFEKKQRAEKLARLQERNIHSSPVNSRTRPKAAKRSKHRVMKTTIKTLSPRPLKRNRNLKITKSHSGYSLRG